MIGKTLGYEARHALFPFLGVRKPTRGGAEKFIIHRPYPGAWRLIRLVDTGAGGIVERDLAERS